MSDSDFSMAETRWTQVIRSKGESSEAKMALKDLTEAYYKPVYRFICDRTSNNDTARDLTQGFFARVLAKYGFDGADPARGRFRSFLLKAVKNYLAEQHAYSQRQKRGGGVDHQSLDAPYPNTESSAPGLQVADRDTLPPDLAFDRLWAHTVLERALANLESTFQSEGKAEHFATLEPWLAGGADRTQAEAAFDLGLSESAVRVAIHRLRQRFRNSVRAELAHTVATGESIEEELQHLFSALG